MTSAIAHARRAALIEAADYCAFYAEERLRLAGDSILHDPIMRGGPLTLDNLERTSDCMADGVINSAAYHAANDIAEHLRGLASNPQPEKD